MKYLGEWPEPSVRILDSAVKKGASWFYISKLTCAGPGFDTMAIQYISLD